jgi:HKD family nuclease
MDKLLFTKLSEKVQNCNSLHIKGYDFESKNITDGFDSAWFQIHERQYGIYCVEIKGKKVYLTEDSNKIARITGKDAEKWLLLAEKWFQNDYSEAILEKEKSDRQFDFLEYDQSYCAQRQFSF